MKYQIHQKLDVKRSFGRQTWNFINKLPRVLQNLIIRRLVTVDKNLPANLIFKLAETPDEIEQALNVAYEAFHDRALVPDAKNRLRVTKFHALPTTFILIGKLNDDIIATMTVVLDSNMGLPLEKHWDIQSIRTGSSRIAEISTLAISRKYRAQRGKILLPLCRFMFHFCTQFLGIEKIVAAVHPEIWAFYRSLLLFNEINGGEIKLYDSAQGAAAVAGWLNFKDLPENYSKVYGNKPSLKNLFHYFTANSPSNYHFGSHTKLICSKYLYSPAKLQYFFQTKSCVLQDLSPSERLHFANIYHRKSYLSLIGPDSVPSETNRAHARFAVNFGLKWHAVESKRILIGQILDVSRIGLRINSNAAASLKAGTAVSILTKFPNGQVVPLTGIVSWSSKQTSQIGIRLSEFRPREYLNLISEFETDLIRMENSDSDGKFKIGSKKLWG